jgi:hypothetical protein
MKWREAGGRESAPECVPPRFDRMTFRIVALTFLTAASAFSALAQGARAPADFTNETLNYNVNWPSGLSLGEAKLEASRTGDRWQFRFTLDAAVPGFAVTDRFLSDASQKDFASIEFEKQSVHGKRKAQEKTTFDQQKSNAVRETLKGGGKSEFSVPAGAKDALAYLFFLRRELSQGRLPPAQAVYFGAPYQVRLEYGGAQTVTSGGNPTQADRLVASVKGPSSDFSFEMLFARDAARTPLAVRVPLAMGTFSLELTR